MRGHDAFRYLVLIALALAYVTILLGGNVAASDSGLACPTWPLCRPGAGLWPSGLDGGVLIEWSHRVAAFVLSASIAAFTLLALVFERRRPALQRLSFAAAGLVLVQVLLGGLVVDTDLSVAAVVAHLGMATALFGVLVVLAAVANLPAIPRRWLAWLRRAGEEAPPTAPESRPGREAVPAGAPEPIAAAVGGRPGS